MNELPPPILAMNIPCQKCSVPDSWYQVKEEDRKVSFLFKCHTCSHEWTSFNKINKKK
jgi:hypothetical protein